MPCMHGVSLERPCEDCLKLTQSRHRIIQEESPAPDQAVEALDEIDKILVQRGQVYGDSDINHTALGRMWGAILSIWWQRECPDIPGDIVCLMKAADKVMRASTVQGRGYQDSYDDTEGYTRLALQCWRRFNKPGTETLDDSDEDAPSNLGLRSCQHGYHPDTCSICQTFHPEHPIKEKR